MKRRFWALFLVTLLFLLLIGAISGPPISAQGQSGFRALSGAEAAGFVVPADMPLLKSFFLPQYGLTYERYQQYFGDAEVLGAQITLYRDSSGTITTVIGSHYPEIVPTNAVGLSRADAEAIAHRDVGAGQSRALDLLINPTTGRYFFRVETRGFDSRWIHWIDAASGALLNKYDALTTDHGTGVKGDTKPVAGLTTFHNSDGHGAIGSHWDLFSTDNRQWTFDKRNSGNPFIYYVTDSDNHWTLVTADRKSPGQPALIDAQYYANVTDDYFLGQHGFNWQTCYTRMQSVAHYGNNYNNAFWNGTYTVYGDGDGVIFRELSGGLDVVSHEHTHGVTDCTSDLIYQDESGALNESFSDILGNSAEFFAAANNLDPSVGPDWFIGEDVYLPADALAGFRNMADPREDDDPDHYSERQTGGGDNGGVHTNSGIPNHAFYLLVNGGQNAGCDATGSNGHTHTADCDVTVAGIVLTKAERIFFVAFTGLPSNATMSNARDATIAAAKSLYPSESATCASVANAWQAVGVSGSATCGDGGAPTPTPIATPTPTPTPTPAPAGTMHVGDLDGQSVKLQKGNWKALVTVTVHDANHNPVANVTVNGTWTVNGSSSAGSCTTVTNTSGQCTVDSGQLPKNKTTATFTVSDLTDALTYSPSANHDPDGDSNGTSITVSK